MNVIETCVTIINNVLGVSRDDLYGVHRDSELVDARFIFAHLCSVNNIKGNRIAMCMGKNPNSISYYINTYKQRVMKNCYFKEKAYLCESKFNELRKNG